MYSGWTKLEKKGLLVSVPLQILQTGYRERMRLMNMARNAVFPLPGIPMTTQLKLCGVESRSHSRRLMTRSGWSAILNECERALKLVLRALDSEKNIWTDGAKRPEKKFVSRHQ